jgi:hypothetical protein
MLINGQVSPAYMHDGPVLAGEDIHTAMANNTVSNLAGHLGIVPIQGVSSGPRPLEDEPTDDAEKASFKTAQSAYRSANGELANGQQDGAPAYDFNDTLRQVRSAVRPGA